jgi:prepilin-type N-terminal cleavage/methylation domain-containing protein/prepilin-type processing-associated H-X9-DG protein
MNPMCLTGGSAVDHGKSASSRERADSTVNCPKLSGFTLIELLVVIAIIAILAAVLLPVLAHAKLKATQAYCINNQKELATAWVMYVGDNRESLPQPYDQAGNFIYKNCNSAGGFWGINKSLPPVAGGGGGAAVTAVALQNAQNCLMTNNLFFQYAGNVGSYHCPGDVRFEEPVGTGKAIGWAYDSYALPENVQPGPVGNATDANGFRKMADIHRVADCMIFVEQGDTRGYNNGTFAISVKVPSVSPINQWEDIFAMYHGNVGTFAFADGHAEAHRWHDNYLIGAGFAAIKLGSVVYDYAQYNSAGGGTGSPPQKGIDAAYIVQHCVCPTSP